MCWCDPTMRTPWCGRGACVPPPVTAPRPPPATDTVALLVRQALGLLEDAYALAGATHPDVPLDALTQAQAGCVAWLREAD